LSITAFKIASHVLATAVERVASEALQDLESEHGEALGAAGAVGTLSRLGTPEAASGLAVSEGASGLAVSDAPGSIGDTWSWSDTDATPYEHSWNAENFDGVGDPVSLGPYQRTQETGYTCGVVAQITVLESMTGEYVSEADARQRATEMGWLSEDGTSLESYGKLLESYGVEVEQRSTCDITDIADALERGDRVMVAVNATEIWNPMRDANGEVVPQPPCAGHAVWVTGIDCQDGVWTVILNDSGTPDGAMEAVSLEDFTQAWSGYDNYAVIAHAGEQ
jgi:hypothetical protein